MTNPFTRIKLPTDLDGFNSLVDRVCRRYKLKDKRHAAAIISVAVRHLPNDSAYTTVSYLGQSVLKNLANYVANYQGESIKHETQVDQLETMLKSDPNNMQARDELLKAATQGSKYAEAALEKLGLLEKTVAPMEPAKAEEIKNVEEPVPQPSV